MLHFKIYLDSDISKDKKLIKQILLDKNGWASKYDISFTTKKKEADVIIYFAENQKIKQMFGDKFTGFSVCSRGKHPHKIYINQNRWDETPHNFKIHRSQIIGGNKKKTEQLYYRQYVLQHELGHSIDKANHDSYNKKTNKHFCPVMFQQTRGNIVVDKALFVPNPWIVLQYKKYDDENLRTFIQTQKSYLKYL